jgi:uncharacterized protein YfbU (UPF0304 family)
MQDYDSRLHRNYQRLRQLVSRGWESITYDIIKHYINTMHDRCQAVIVENGGIIKY